MLNAAMNKFYGLSVFVAWALLLSTVSNAQDTGVAEELTLNQRLSSIVTTIKERERLIGQDNQRLTSTEDPTLTQQLTQKINTDKEIIQELREQFVTLSTGGEKIYVERKSVEQKINWQEDLEAIFAPLITQLKEISERPKVIEALEQEIDYWGKRSEQLNKAINYMKTSLNIVSDKEVKARLNELLSDAQGQYRTALQKLALSQSQLVLVEENENPFWVNIIDLTKSFAASLLYYFTLALLFAFVAYQLVSLLTRIPRLMIDKKQPKRYVFATRVINLVKRVIGFSLGIIVYLTVLYSSAQWILLVISLFLLIGGVLTLRNVVPKYVVEIRTLLNLGSIRQGERVVYHGLIWKINLIDVYTHLHNPALDAHLRVPIANLIDASSRPFHKDESWFPTALGDVVLLEDGAFGKIKHQSADIVEIDFGRSIYTYRTVDFIDKRPRNLSSGFTVFEVFGFDYQHQNISVNTLLDQYKTYVETALKQHRVGEYCTYFNVEFDKAAASSLDFKVIASFSGEAAEDFFRISRIIQTASVNAANHYGWVIPFQQITLHQADAGTASTSE